MNNYIEEKLKEFDRELVEMNLFKGRDMHNRPPLYDTPDEKIEEIKQFIKQALQEQEERIIDEERQRRKEEKCKTARINYDAGYCKAEQEMKEKIEKQIKHYEELQEEIRSMRESNRNETRIIDSEQTEFAKALCGHYECLMCGNMVNGFNKYCPHCGRINKDY